MLTPADACSLQDISSNQRQQQSFFLKALLCLIIQPSQNAVVIVHADNIMSLTASCRHKARTSCCSQHCTRPISMCVRQTLPSGNALGNALLHHHKLRCTAILQAFKTVTALKMTFTRLLWSYTYTDCKCVGTNLVIAASNRAALCDDPHSHLSS